MADPYQVVKQMTVVAQATPDPTKAMEPVALFFADNTPVPTPAAATGTATLVAGTVTVADTKITANSRIRVMLKTPGGAVGAPFVSAITASTGFTLKSTSGTDTSVLSYEVLSY